MLYCFNCKSRNHGFHYCRKKLYICKTCNTKGHTEQDCELFNTLCYRCMMNGILNIKCKKHESLKRCGAIIIDDCSRILLVQNHSNVWSLPKGHQTHCKESYIQCAIREVYEETGLKLKITKNFKKLIIGDIVYFIIRLDNYFKKFQKIRDTHEVKQIKWTHINDIPSLENSNWSLRKLVQFIK